MANKGRIKHTLEQLLIDKQELSSIIGEDAISAIIKYYEKINKRIDSNFIPSSNRRGARRITVDKNDVFSLDTSGIEAKIRIENIQSQTNESIYSLRGMIELAYKKIAGKEIDSPEEYAKLAISLMDCGLFKKTEKMATGLFRQIKLLFPEFTKERLFREAMRDAGYGRDGNWKAEDFFPKEVRDRWRKEILDTLESTITSVECEIEDRLWMEESGIKEGYNAYLSDLCADYYQDYS